HAALPTVEDLAKFKVEILDEEIGQTPLQLVKAIMDDYNAKLLQEIAITSVHTLNDKGVEAARELLAESVGLFANLEDKNSVINISDLTNEFIQNYYETVKNKGVLVGIPTGFPLIDAHIRGFKKQWLVVISGRNGNYKTWFLLSIAINAWKNGQNIAIFSAEMSNAELQNRIHALAANLPPTKLQHGLLDDNEMVILDRYLAEKDLPPYGKLFLCDMPTTMDKIIIDCNDLKKSNQLDAIFIDSVYLLSSKGESETVRLKKIADEAKKMAKKLDLPVIVTTQLNRDFAKANQGKEQTVSGGHYIYGTDAWNQNADVNITINVPEKYKEHKFVELILNKYRHGAQDEQWALRIALDKPKVEQVDIGYVNTIVGNRDENLFQEKS
ncbi:MAG TPA: DnaB-like helicase C-terminal domain-containing protein, partial [Waddliaceae bacterium]